MREEYTAQLVNCSEGIEDCNYISDSSEGYCSLYNENYTNPNELGWILILSSFVAAIMAYGLGANDASNSLGSSIGSGAITPRKALFLGSLCEWTGAVLMGHGVSTTIQSNLISPLTDPSCYACGYCNSSMSLYSLSMFSSLCSASIFLLLATFTSMPVSTTHAIIGGVLGSTLFSVGSDCISFSLSGVSGVFVSWVVSPLLSGSIASITLILTRKKILLAQYPTQTALKALPFLYSFTSFILSFLIFMKSSVTKGLSQLNSALFALILSVMVFFACYRFLVPHVRANLPSKFQNSTELVSNESEQSFELENLDPSLTKRSSGDLPHQPLVETISDPEEFGIDSISLNDPLHQEEKVSLEEQDALYVFRYLLLFQAFLEAFAHGSNDTANATGAFSAIYHTINTSSLPNKILSITNSTVIYTELDNEGICGESSSSMMVMFFGGLFVFLGINTLGIRVVTTVGTSITKLNFHRAYCIEFGTSLAVVLATVVGMPISTTHCQVGAVIVIGSLEKGIRNVRWPLVSRIVLTWLVSVPFAALLSLLFMVLLKPTIM